MHPLDKGQDPLHGNPLPVGEARVLRPKSECARPPHPSQGPAVPAALCMAGRFLLVRRHFPGATSACALPAHRTTLLVRTMDGATALGAPSLRRLRNGCLPAMEASRSCSVGRAMRSDKRVRRSSQPQRRQSWVESESAASHNESLINSRCGGHASTPHNCARRRRARGGKQWPTGNLRTTWSAPAPNASSTAVGGRETSCCTPEQPMICGKR